MQINQNLSMISERGKLRYKVNKEANKVVREIITQLKEKDIQDKDKNFPNIHNSDDTFSEPKHVQLDMVANHYLVDNQLHYYKKRFSDDVTNSVNRKSIRDGNDSCQMQMSERVVGLGEHDNYLGIGGSGMNDKMTDRTLGSRNREHWRSLDVQELGIRRISGGGGVRVVGASLDNMQYQVERSIDENPIYIEHSNIRGQRAPIVQQQYMNKGFTDSSNDDIYT